MGWETSLGLEAAVRRFPGQAENVHQLARTSEAFRDMCEELAVTEAALRALSATGPAGERIAGEGAARRAECEGWIARLTEEMSAALRQSKIISLPARGRR